MEDPRRERLHSDRTHADGPVEPICWVDGTIVPADQPIVRADDSGFAQGRACFTTARVADGRVRFRSRHVARLVHGAHALGLGTLRDAVIESAFDDLLSAAFPKGDGIVRIQVSTDSTGLRVVGVPRALGTDSPAWRAISVEISGPAPFPLGIKTSARSALVHAWQQALAAGVDEAVIRNGEGLLVEGTRTNLIVVRSNGEVATPPLETGAVAGIARAICLERVTELVEAPILVSELASATELIATNAVRGARAITHVDGEPIGTGQPGSWFERLSDILDGD